MGKEYIWNGGVYGGREGVYGGKGLYEGWGRSIWGKGVYGMGKECMGMKECNGDEE